MLNRKSCKIKKPKAEKSNRGRPKDHENIKNSELSFKKLKENPDIVYQLKITAEISKLILKSPNIEEFYLKMQKENRSTSKKKEKSIKYCNEIKKFSSQKKQDFFDFVSLILEKTGNQLGLSSLCNEVLSWLLQYFVKEMNEFDASADQKNNLSIITQQILDKIKKNVLRNWKIHDYFDEDFVYSLFRVFENCRKCFE